MTPMLPSLPLVFSAVLMSSAPAIQSTLQPASTLPACIHSRAEPRYLGFAYDHFVVVHNACDKQAACSVSTNANPDPIEFNVASKETLAVLTFRANPSSEFTYQLQCSLTQ